MHSDGTGEEPNGASLQHKLLCGVGPLDTLAGCSTDTRLAEEQPAMSSSTARPMMVCWCLLHVPSMPSFDLTQERATRGGEWQDHGRASLPITRTSPQHPSSTRSTSEEGLSLAREQQALFHSR